MLESDLPYQQSWFDRGMPCEGLRGRSNIDPKCFSHSGPRADQLGLVIPGQQFIFEAVDSRSIDVIRAMNRFGNPVTVSILGHPEMWRASTHTGQFVLTARHKQECQSRKVHCSGHAALIVGYDITRRLFMIKNSWGRAWGESGYGTISFDYLEQMSHRKFLTGYTQY